MSRNSKPRIVFSFSNRDYYIDPRRESLGEYFLDKDGREIFTHLSGPNCFMHYYFGTVAGFPGKIFRITVVLTPPPRIRSAAYPSGGQYGGDGTIRAGIGNGNYS